MGIVGQQVSLYARGVLVSLAGKTTMPPFRAAKLLPPQIHLSVTGFCNKQMRLA
jgi:hypothetical protein